MNEMQIEFAKYGGIGVSRESIWESRDKRKICEVERAAAVDCVLKFGSPEQRPVISAVIGCALMTPSYLLFQHMRALWSVPNIRVNVRYEVGFLVLVVVGAWMIYQALVRKRYYVAVTTSTGVVRLAFEKSAELSSIRTFLVDAGKQFGWHVREDCNERR